MKTFFAKLILFYCLVTWFLPTMAQNQTDVLAFTKIRPVSQGYTVYFDATGIRNESHAETILQSLIDDSEAFDGRYFKTRDSKDRFQLYFYDEIKASDIRDILLKYDADYAFSHVSINGEIPNRKKKNQQISIEGQRIPIDHKDYPKFKNTENPELDAIEYKNKKKQWIENNPEKYKKLLENMRSN